MPFGTAINLINQTSFPRVYLQRMLRERGTEIDFLIMMMMEVSVAKVMMAKVMMPKVMMPKEMKAKVMMAKVTMAKVI